MHCSICATSASSSWSDELRKAGARRPFCPASHRRAGGRAESFLAYGRWLTRARLPSSNTPSRALREKGNAFEIVVETQKRACSSKRRDAAAPPTSRLRLVPPLSNAMREHAELRHEHQRVSAEHDSPAGAGARASTCRCGCEDPRWSPELGPIPAYASAVEAESPESAIAEDKQVSRYRRALIAVATHHLSEPVFLRAACRPWSGATAKGLRHHGRGLPHLARAGLASDVTEIENVSAELWSAHCATTPTRSTSSTTAVAIFDERQKLRFFNQAFQKLWNLDTVFLESAPDHALLLDRLRSDGMLAEQPEWRRWKRRCSIAYRAADPQEHWWHLAGWAHAPRRRQPATQGRRHLGFRETCPRKDRSRKPLQHGSARVGRDARQFFFLAEGVAVFGPDGRLRLVNPAFSSLWRCRQARRHRHAYARSSAPPATS